MNETDFCCRKMIQVSKEIRDTDLVNHIVVYNKRHREFFVYFNDELEGRDREMLADIFWCPWCGTKLPKSLGDEWWDILEQEYGIKDPDDSESGKVPSEFWSDEWWKKRGL